jgi:hypothetical protein
MMLASLVLAASCMALTTVLSLQMRAASIWRRSLVAFRLLLPTGLSTDDVARWLNMVAASSFTPRLAHQSFAMSLELVATSTDGIRHYLVLPKYAHALVKTLEVGLPGVRMEPAPDHLASTAQVDFARELTITSSRRPLAVERAETVSTAFLGSLQPLARGQEIRAAWYLTGARTPGPVRAKAANTASATPWWLASSAPADADELSALKVKQRDPLVLTTLRIGAKAATVQDARRIVRSITLTLRGANAPGVRVVHRMVPSWIVVPRLTDRRLPITGRSAMLLNTRELVALIGFPMGDSFIPGLGIGTSRQLPPLHGTPRAGLVLARSTWPGSDAEITTRTDDRLRHTHVIGPTGTGKSTLLANMALQDAKAGHGFALIDPKSDLVEDVLARLPKSRHADVIVLDPAAYARGNDYPIVGLNLLGHAHTEADRELVVDHIVHIISELWRDSFGPRTADVLRNALLTLVNTKAADGSAYTLIDIAELLTNPTFRRSVVSQSGVPDAVRPIWTDYERYSEPQKVQVIGPSLNKLRALSTRSSLRLMLGQSTGLNIADVLNRGKILLVPLNKGIIGVDSAHLLGSLVVSSLVNATFARAGMPAAQRRPAYIYLDEFQDVLRLPLDIADLLAQARGLGVGLVLAHQLLGQLPEAVKRSVLGTARSSVVFQLDYDDAKVFERRFAPLTATDLCNLPNFEVALRLSVGGTTQRPVTGMTLALPDVEGDGSELARASADRYGTARSEVEAAIRIRTTPGLGVEQSPRVSTFGRRKLGDGT